MVEREHTRKDILSSRKKKKQNALTDFILSVTFNCLHIFKDTWFEVSTVVPIKIIVLFII